jgi:hypothetical protein
VSTNNRDTNPHAVTRWVVDHAPFVASVGLFLLVVMRVLRVSSFDVATASTLIRETSVVSLVLGVLVGVLPGLLSGAAIYLLILATGPGAPTYRSMAWFAVVLIWFLLTVLLPWIALIITTLLLVGIFLAQRKLKWPLEVWAVISFLLTVVIDQPRMWLPPERISVAGTHLTGYVLDAGSEWTTVMLEDDRSIVIVQSAEVEERTVCNLAPRSSGRTIGQLILGEEGGSRNPLCEERGNEDSGDTVAPSPTKSA